jgi:hypothetical protein
MKRDLDLVRSILQWMEAHPHGSVANQQIMVQGHTDEEIGYHAHLMHQAGLIRAAELKSMDSQSPLAMPLSITWEGHDFLDAAKDESLWAKAKTKVIAPAGGVAFSLLLDWLKAEGKSRLGLPP